MEFCNSTLLSLVCLSELARGFLSRAVCADALRCPLSLTSILWLGCDTTVLEKVFAATKSIKFVVYLHGSDLDCPCSLVLQSTLV